MMLILLNVFYNLKGEKSTLKRLSNIFKIRKLCHYNMEKKNAYSSLPYNNCEFYSVITCLVEFASGIYILVYCVVQLPFGWVLPGNLLFLSMKPIFFGQNKLGKE